MSSRPLQILAATAVLWLFARPAFCAAERTESSTLFPMVEIAFTLPEEPAEPFAREFWGWIEDEGGGGIWAPAFYDGGGTWKMRHTPTAAGHRRIAIYAGDGGIRKVQRTATLSPAEFDVGGESLRAGFVRVNPEDPRRFMRGSGVSYFPVGLNIGWDAGAGETVEAILTKLAAAEGNWSRIWMCHWDGKNLDWRQNGANRPGEFDLAVARRWDRIVALAERLDVPFQLVLQHHGQFSTTVNANWQDNPWNQANGGFLARPEDFFTEEKARALTRGKFRYIVARYGYSPAIMAWELFNEVEFTDAAKTAEGRQAILEWHQEMAGYLRSIDPNRHLITTSALPLADPVWMVADYFQQHGYPPDPLSGSGGFDADPLALSRPVFYGEIGTTDQSGATPGDGGRCLRNILLGAMFSGAGGAAQYWAWDHVARENLFPLIKSAAALAKMAGLGRGVWRRVPGKAITARRVDLVFGPGQRWNSVVDPRIALRPDGGSRPEGTGWSATLRPRRGSGEREGTDTVSFPIELKESGRWELTVDEVSEAGATMEMIIDGRVLQSRTWEPVSPSGGRQLPEVIGVALPATAKILTVRSSGRDYFRLASMRLRDYAPELGVKAMTNDDKVLLWIYRSDGLSEAPMSGGDEAFSTGTIQLAGLRNGAYRMTWWDTLRSTIIKENEAVVSEGKLEFPTLPVRTDVALLLTRKEVSP